VDHAGSPASQHRVSWPHVGTLCYVGLGWRILTASFRLSWGDAPDTAAKASLAAFVTIAAGGFGCIIGGLIADRIGRTALTIGAMSVNGACFLLIGRLLGASPALVVTFCMIWGTTVVADSPQSQRA
jgi:nitrate/nitrite transporter NarK